MGDGNDLNYISLLLVDNGERKSVEQDPANPLREGSTALWCRGDPIDRCVHFLDESHGSAFAPFPVPLPLGPQRSLRDAAQSVVGALATNDPPACFRPRNWLHGPRVQLSHPTADLRLPGGFGILVNLLIKAVQKGAGKRRPGFGGELQGFLQQIRCLIVHRPFLLVQTF